MWTFAALTCCRWPRLSGCAKARRRSVQCGRTTASSWIWSLTRHHAHHYRGFATTRHRPFTGTGELKPLPYTMRNLLSGIALMRTGRLEAHLPTLADQVPEAPGYLADLMAAKASGEHPMLTRVPGAPPAQAIESDIARLHGVLDEAQRDSALPEEPSAEPPHCTTSSSVPACRGEPRYPGPLSRPDHPPRRHRPRGCLVTSL